MSDTAEFDLTKTMEQLIDAHERPHDIMRDLLAMAGGVNASAGCDRFRIGEHVYSLDDLQRIQDEEQDAFVAKHR